MRAHETNAHVQEHACGALRSMAANHDEENQTRSIINNKRKRLPIEGGIERAKTQPRVEPDAWRASPAAWGAREAQTAPNGRPEQAISPWDSVMGDL